VLHETSALLSQGSQHNISQGWQRIFEKNISAKHHKEPFMYRKVFSDFIAFVVSRKRRKLEKHRNK